MLEEVWEGIGREGRSGADVRRLCRNAVERPDT
jgi:hypothetical protein